MLPENITDSQVRLYRNQVAEDMRRKFTGMVDKLIRVLVEMKREGSEGDDKVSIPSTLVPN